MRNLIRWLIRRIIDLIADVSVIDYENLPQEGGFVIATNHLGFMDVPFSFYALQRWDTSVMVAEKWGKIRLFSWIGKHFNFIFIDRFHPDIKAMRKVITLMEEGKILIIAPEGTRSRVGSLIEGKPGVSYLATKLNRPIIPAGITGTDDKIVLENLKRFRRSHFIVTAGR